MRRLSGEDAGFLSMEQPEQAMNTIAVATLASADGSPTAVTIEDVRTHVLSRLDQLPSFRWRIVPVPFGLGQPMCMRDPQFDVDFHLREVTLAPGESLDDRFCRLAEQHLDRRHPLWQLTLVHGVADDDGRPTRQALILKYHHALADGVAALTIFSRVFSDAPREPVAEQTVPWTPERIPSRLVLLVLALVDLLASLVDLPGLALRTARGLGAVKDRKATSPVAVPEFSAAAPNSALNDAFTPERSYVRFEVPLAEVRRIKDAAGVTLNDVALATISGGLRGYLEERDELPSLPLLASVPVAYEPPDAPVRQSGNRFWSFTTTLATDVADPGERLAEISAVAAEAKGQLTTLGPDLLPRWLDYVPPCISGPGAKALIARLRAAGPDDLVDANVLISNIRGPAEPWTVLGCDVVDLYLDGPPSNGVGLNVMLWSYGDRLLFGILAFADALRDPEALTRHLEAAFADLSALPT